MLKKNLFRILSTVLVIAVLITLPAFFAASAKSIPESSMGSPEDLVPDVIFGTKGTNTLLENNLSGENDDSETSPNNPTDLPENKNEQIPEGIPETPKKDNDGNKDPNKNNPSNAFDGDAAGDGSGNIGGEGGDGNPTVVTDLENKIVTSSELSGDMFSFFAYIENGSEKHSLTVNFKNNETKASGEVLETADDYYEAKLALGANYFTIFLEEDEKTVSSVQYIITYQAEKADASNPDVGEGVYIETSLDDDGTKLSNKYYTFCVYAESSVSGTLYSNHIRVELNGRVVDNPTGSKRFEYDLVFGESPNQTVEVTAWDDYGNSSYRCYEIEFSGGGDGSSIGTATVIIDATPAGLGIIGEYEIEILQGDTAAKTLVDAAGYMGLSVHYSGTTENGFYVKGISGYAGTPEVPPELWECVLRDGLSLTGAPSGGLFAGDFTSVSGWMYSINGTLYPGRGLSAYNLSDGDTLYLRFTVAGGKDIGGSGIGDGTLAGYCGIWSDGGYYELDHEYSEVDRVEPTETEDGYIEYECDICHKHETEPIPATGEGDGGYDEGEGEESE